MEEKINATADPIITGLSSEEARLRAERGQTNTVKEKSGKSYLKIIGDNLFTFFNLIWAIITVVLILVESYGSLTFLMVVVLNLVVAIVQESRAKAAVEKLSLATDPRATVIRDGEEMEISTKDIVLDDVVRIEIGRQVPSDGVVISGICEANESMLTGESVPIKKQAGDRVMAGSFLVSGCVYVHCDRVGKDNYIHTLEKEAKAFKAPSSNLFRDLNKLIKTIGGFLIFLKIPLPSLYILIEVPYVCSTITIKQCGD